MPTVKTRVRVILDIHTNDNWMDACKIDQIKKQSMDDAQLTFSKMLYDLRDKVTIVKPPEFVSIQMILGK